MGRENIEQIRYHPRANNTRVVKYLSRLDGLAIDMCVNCVDGNWVSEKKIPKISVDYDGHGLTVLALLKLLFVDPPPSLSIARGTCILTAVVLSSLKR